MRASHVRTHPVKRFSLSTTLFVLALALSGCSNTPGPSTETSAAAPTTVEATAKTVEQVKVRSADEVLESALEAGRPSAAFDKNCEVWKMPLVDSDGQEWANALMIEFFETQSAQCPDAITFPHYYIDTFEPGVNGELVITVEQYMNVILHGPERGRYFELDSMAQEVMHRIMKDNSSLKKVTVKMPNGERYGSATRKEVEQARADGRL